MGSQAQSPAMVMRILKYAFVVSGFLFVYVGFEVLAKPQHQASQPIQLAITLVGLTCVVAGFLLPGVLFRTAEGRSQGVTAKTDLQRWMTKGIISLAYFEACILFGLVLQCLGARASLVGLLFGAGIAAELFWSPGAPPGTQSEEFPQS